MKKHLFIIGLLLMSLVATSHDQGKIDSLKKVFEDTYEDTIKVKALNSLAQQYLGADPKKTFEYAKEKACIVAISKIDSIEGNQVTIGNDKLPISRNLKEEVLTKIVNTKLLNKM
ncbi:hypothetical protein JYU23_01145 [bacterium AH-315-C07]|nr:hypothetical protein [bacterium AH-315-C07]